MFRNIIIEWTDVSWKEQLWKLIEMISFKSRCHLKDILENSDINWDNITQNDIEKLYSYYKYNNIISDRSFFSLLNYLIFKKSLILDNKFKIRNLLKQYLLSVSWSTIIVLISDYNTTVERLLFRRDYLKEQLSENDLIILNNKSYFLQYRRIMNYLYRLSKKIIAKNHINVRTIMLDTSFISLKWIHLYFLIKEKIYKLSFKYENIYWISSKKLSTDSKDY